MPEKLKQALRLVLERQIESKDCDDLLAIFADVFSREIVDYSLLGMPSTIYGYVRAFFDRSNPNWRKIFGHSVFTLVNLSNKREYWVQNVCENDLRWHFLNQSSFQDAKIVYPELLDAYQSGASSWSAGRTARSTTPPMNIDLALPISLRYSNFKAKLENENPACSSFFGSKLSADQERELTCLVRSESPALQNEIRRAFARSPRPWWTRFSKRL